MLTLITGVPGAGKTLWLITELKNGIKYPDRDENRPVYYYGIPSLSPELGWHPINDPKNWHTEVPDGAIVVIDEVQEHFPVRDHKKPVPDGLQALERHRHRGLDIYFLTQHPSLVDHHARRLVGQHCHLKRNFGASFAVLYRANECIDPKDYHQLTKAEKTTFKYPKDSFAFYKSSEIHTHKFRLPKKLLLIPLIFIVIGVCVYYFYQALFSDEKSESGNNGQSIKSKMIGDVETAGRAAHKGVEVVDYTIQSFIPQITNIPASAPIYSKLWEPKSAPILSSCISTKTKCRCYSQQGTVISVSEQYCENIIKNGFPYDHTLPDNREDQDNEKVRHK